MLATFSKSDDDKKKPDLFRLTEIEPHFVSLVSAGANRQRKFQIVKADTGTALLASDAGEDKLKQEKERRAKAYEIEALEATPTAPVVGAPTFEEMYGDPVNLGYPFGKEDNKIDPDIIATGLAQYKTNKTYAEEKSTGVVYGRIVEAALAADITVSYDEEDPVDKLLSAEIKKRLLAQSKDDDTDDDDEDEKGCPAGDGKKPRRKPKKGDESGSPGADGTDPLAWLERAGDTVEGLEFISMLDTVNVSPSLDDDASSGSDPEADVGKSQDTPTVKQLADKVRQLEAKLEAEKKAREKAEARVAELEKNLNSETKLKKKAQARVTKLKNGMGGSTALVTGEVGVTKSVDNEDDGDPTEAPWAGGGDLAAKVARKKKK